MANIVVNGGFESSVLPGSGVTSGSTADSTGTWSFFDGSGLYSTGALFNGNGAVLLAPQGGSNAAWIYTTNGQEGNNESRRPGGGAISQIVLGTAASYTLTFYSAQQLATTSKATLRVRFRALDNTVSKEFEVSPTTSYVQSSFALGTLAAKSYVLTFDTIPAPYFTPGSSTYNATVLTGMLFLDTVVIS